MSSELLGEKKERVLILYLLRTKNIDWLAMNSDMFFKDRVRFWYAWWMYPEGPENFSSPESHV